MKEFNTTGICIPEKHYMVNIEKRLKIIRGMVDEGKYFVINRARQYGKTTTLEALKSNLEKDYVVIGMDFQIDMSSAKFRDENTFSIAFARSFLELTNACDMEMPERMAAAMSELQTFIAGNKENMDLVELFRFLSRICNYSPRPMVLIIDEVDSATNNQVFLDFLAQLRGYYLKRRDKATFHSVILAGVYDIKNIKWKIRPGEDSKENSPWNIAADFEVEMSFSKEDIEGMLEDYEKDYKTGMNLRELAELIFDYTLGYPFLVSRLCKLMDEKLSRDKRAFPSPADVWTKRGLLEAVKLLTEEENTLFDSMDHKLNQYQELSDMLYALLFTGKNIAYTSGIRYLDLAARFGFVRKKDGQVQIANRIFEMRLYDKFLAQGQMKEQMYEASLTDKNQFIKNGILGMKLVLEKFVLHFTDLYGNSGMQFIEENGRRFFLLYLRPIINGTGNYYVEAQTRDRKRTDVIVDYLGKQYIIEMKIWHGQEYNGRGENQLLEYLDYYHLDEGYMLSFNFNQKKETGVKELNVQGKKLIEAVV